MTILNACTNRASDEIQSDKIYYSPLVEEASQASQASQRPLASQGFGCGGLGGSWGGEAPPHPMQSTCPQLAEGVALHGGVYPHGPTPPLAKRRTGGKISN